MSSLGTNSVVAAVAAFALLCSPARASDTRASAEHVDYGASFSVDTSFYTTEANEPATTSTIACTDGQGAPKQRSMAKTAWYRVTGNGRAITLSTAGSSYDTLLAVYPLGSSTPSACSDDTSATDVTSKITGFSTSDGATYEVQVGLTGGANCSGCNLRLAASSDAPPAPSPQPQPSPPPNHDLDGDGVDGNEFGGPDCHDGSGAIHPGAVDTPHDGIDQDCDGRDAPYPALTSRASLSARTAHRVTRVKSLTVRGAPIGAAVFVTCAGRHVGCPFKRRTRAVRSPAALALGALFAKARLRPGAVIELRVTQAGMIGNVTRFAVRAGKPPARTTLCLEPGATRPQRTCS